MIETIKTLSWIEHEANGIVSAWNGGDKKFDYDGEIYTDEQASAAEELLQKIKEVRALVRELGI